MKSLIVGGTGFLGGAITEAAISAGHEVTILSRGKLQRDLPPSVEILTADRHASLNVLCGREFDFIFDTCAFTPSAVGSLLTCFPTATPRYVLISSISVYETFRTQWMTESAPTPTARPADYDVAASVAPENRANAIAYGASYGRLKRAAEQVAEDMLGDNALILRVGQLIGAGDYTDRLTWWVRRVDEGGRIPAPAPPQRPIQMIDIHDAAQFAVHTAEQGRSGHYNLTGEPEPMCDVLASIRKVTDSSAQFVWCEKETFETVGIAPWVEMPLLIPWGDDFRYFMELSTQKAQEAGLICRPLTDTLKPLLAWDRARRTQPLKCGLSQEKEAMLLAQVE